MDAIEFRDLLKGHLHDPDFAGLTDLEHETAQELERTRSQPTFLLVTLPAETGHGGRFLITVTEVK